MTIFNANEYNAATQLVADAIGRSVSHTEIVHVDGYSMRDAIVSELGDECEGSTDDGQGGMEFWGQDLNGEAWRVHVTERST